jgi:tRNA(fMet)-specific endonuclease VapC
MTRLALALLDTDTLSEIIKGKHPGLMRKSREYLTTQGHFSFSIMTRYEILRGLKAKGATTKLAAFERFCLANHILPLTDPIIVRAAEIYADLKQRGQLISDADILIAATAITHGLTLVTNNTVHYARIGGLALANWKSP